MDSLSAIQIQRVYRGWEGRKFARFAKHVTKSAIAVQSAFRVRCCLHYVYTLMRILSVRVFLKNIFYMCGWRVPAAGCMTK